MAELHNLHNKKRVGSSHGWLIMVDHQTPSIFAVDPRKPSIHIQLPSLLSFPDVLEFDGNDYLCLSPFLGTITKSKNSVANTHVQKVVLSKHPTQESVVAVAIFGHHKRLAFCRVGDEKWKTFKAEDVEQEYLYGYEDVVFGKGDRFFAVNYDGVITTCDSVMPLLECVCEPLIENDRADKRYLVFDNKGKLMMVNRYMGYWDKIYEDGESENDEDSDCDDDDDESGEEEGESDYYAKNNTSKFSVFRVNGKKRKLEEVDGQQDGFYLLDH